MNLKWTTKPPTKVGYYLAVHKEHILGFRFIGIAQILSPHDIKRRVCGSTASQGIIGFGDIEQWSEEAIALPPLPKKEGGKE